MSTARASATRERPWMHVVPEPDAPETCASDVYSPQLLQRTFHVLSLFTAEQQEWTVTEIGRACNLAVPTAYRILTALHRNGYLVRDESTKRFRLGPTVLRLGRTAALSTDLRALARPLLAQLAERTGETAVLTVAGDDHRSAICLELVDGREPLPLSVRPGCRLPLHAGAAQKILLAHQRREEREDYLALPLEPLCQGTVVDPEALVKELDVIRERGWATSFEETDCGVWGISVALIDETGRAAASLGVAGPRARMPRNLNPWLTLLAKQAACLAEPLGFSPSLHLPHPRVVRRHPDAPRPSHRAKENIT